MHFILKTNFKVFDKCSWFVIDLRRIITLNQFVSNLRLT